MVNAQKIPGTAAAWESGALGENLESARVVSQDRAGEIDEALGLQSISIRLPKSLISNFKLISKIHGMGYQPLMREALARFAQGEMNILLNEYASKLKSEAQEAEAAEKAKKVA